MRSWQVNDRTLNNYASVRIVKPRTEHALHPRPRVTTASRRGGRRHRRDQHSRLGMLAGNSGAAPLRGHRRQNADRTGNARLFRTAAAIIQIAQGNCLSHLTQYPSPVFTAVLGIFWNCPLSHCQTAAAWLCQSELSATPRRFQPGFRVAVSQVVWD